MKSRMKFIVFIILHSFVLAPVKILSKKEQKRLEDEEFERIMNEANVADTAASSTPTAAEESKTGGAAGET